MIDLEPLDLIAPWDHAYLVAGLERGAEPRGDRPAEMRDGADVRPLAEDRLDNTVLGQPASRRDRDRPDLRNPAHLARLGPAPGPRALVHVDVHDGAGRRRALSSKRHQRIGRVSLRPLG